MDVVPDIPDVEMDDGVTEEQSETESEPEIVSFKMPTLLELLLLLLNMNVHITIQQFLLYRMMAINFCFRKEKFRPMKVFV